MIYLIACGAHGAEPQEGDYYDLMTLLRHKKASQIASRNAASEQPVALQRKMAHRQRKQNAKAGRRNSRAELQRVLESAVHDVLAVTAGPSQRHASLATYTLLAKDRI